MGDSGAEATLALFYTSISWSPYPKRRYGDNRFWETPCYR